MHAFTNSQYLVPGSISELAAILKSSANPKLLSGGTDLLVQLHHSSIQVNTIVDVKKIPEFCQLVLDENGLLIGAAVTCTALAEFQDIKKKYPGLVEAAELIGSVQIQNRSSIGGNLCNGSPSADTTAALIVNEAICTIGSTRGNRDLQVDEFVLSPGQTALAQDEFLINIRLPVNGPGTSDAYLRLIPRSEMDIAVAGAAVKLRMNQDGACTWARVAISAVAPRPILVADAAAALVNSNLDENSLKKLQEAVRAAADPISDKRGTRDYRLHVVGVLAKRAALIARDRAMEKM
ncbi:MAG: CO/xanthine dehydrogenase FAD-binding subunit [Gammaproteobacteria bacterium]|jgi:CO/xanthine dehydrogenase FAD-binding subunit